MQPSSPLERLAHRPSRRRAAPLPPSDRELLERLAQRLAVRGASPSTAKIYRGWTRRFLAVTARHRTDPAAAIDRFVAVLREQETSDASQRQALAAIGFYFREVHGLDLGATLNAKRPGRRSGAAVSAGPSPATTNSPRGTVDPLVEQLARASGRDASVIAALRVGDVDLERGRLRLRRDGALRRSTVEIMITPELRDALLERIGECWRAQQLDFLAWLDRQPDAGMLGGRLPTEVFRRQPLFPPRGPAPHRDAPRRRPCFARLLRTGGSSGRRMQRSTDGDGSSLATHRHQRSSQTAP